MSLATAEVFDCTNGAWSGTGNLLAGRYEHTSTLLPNGKVLVAGGYNAAAGAAVATAEIYDPATGNWAATGSPLQPRLRHTATLLANGKVLIAGGISGGGSGTTLASAEIYDPATGAWSATGSLSNRRSYHSATLLRSGFVLIACGQAPSGGSDTWTAELYDPATGTFSPTPRPIQPRDRHTATLLPSGKVLVTGGYSFSACVLATAELYDPANDAWSSTTSLPFEHIAHTATLLPNGKVLVAGGVTCNTGAVRTANLYNPANSTWETTGSLNTPRAGTAILLPTGKVLMFSGPDSETYDPVNGSWSLSGSLGATKYGQQATLLPNGKVLATGGSSSSPVTSHNSAHLYDTGLGFQPDWQPAITTADATFANRNRVNVTGTNFQGISQASGGSVQDSSTNYPIVQLRTVDGGQVAFVPAEFVSGWSDTTFTSRLTYDFPPGPALVTVFTNGIPSTAKYLLVEPAPTATSRKSHAPFPGFVYDITLPLAGAPAIECRDTGGNQSLVFAFPVAVTGADSVTITSGVGTVSSSAVGTNPKELIVDLTGVASQQYISVAVDGVRDASASVVVDSLSVTMGVLPGDITGNGAVNAADIGKLKSVSGNSAQGGNFRNDVNVNGAINASDIGLVKALSGTSLPATTAQRSETK